jgi:hypothetical protein
MNRERSFLSMTSLNRMKLPSEWNSDVTRDAQRRLHASGRRTGRRDFLPLSLSIIVEINVFRKALPVPLGRRKPPVATDVPDVW